jgi:CBS-domain-containing membrane protein
MAEANKSVRGFLRRTALRFRMQGQLIDPKFLSNSTRYVIQCFIVCCTMLAVLLFLDSVYHTVFIAGLGASSIVVFSAPSMRASRPRCLLGGYIVGITGVVQCHILQRFFSAFELFDARSVGIIFGAIAVGLAMFLMATTDTEHPPGAAIALGFVLNEWDFMTIVVVMAGICLISLVKELARNWLIDLL